MTGDSEGIVIKSHHFSAILPVSQTVFNWQKTDFIEVLKNAANTAGLTVVGEVSFAFQPQGVSAVILLAESHIALHFWPEESKVTIDIHICDYQKDNLVKAQLLTQILTQEMSSCEYLNNWHYFAISG
ncbi:S-adenosylmethionine decarboxylase family protein [Sphaerospermopsis aphanizomenoides]|uniref:S-adenosylmethionine decarboxylase family protein n=1 Tax=Sphaerospermopsis aphanizomenoides TaxID=459663 RepID=UPI002D7E1DE2|nr:S-adenosylmethionine decarboxylase [Sphaerospermopsis aphanizomenoides]